ncbi:unnamed protein product [Closterium sp. Naga37s-1]|nr:unnamed protein product [Closterium sp. Naga37s-1]
MAKELYDAVVAHYSSPSTSALGRIMLPYLFPELSNVHSVADLMTHLRSSDARYRAALKPAFLTVNQPPMYITLCYPVTRLPDSLCAVRDHFLTLDPTELTLALLEKHLLEAKTSTVAVAASRGTPRSPFFEGCSPSILALSVATVALVDFFRTEEVGAASAPSGRCHSDKGKGGKGGGGGAGGVVAAVEVAGVVEVVEWAEGARLVAAEALGVDSSTSHASRSHAPLKRFVSGLSSVAPLGVVFVARTSGARVPRLVSPAGRLGTLSTVASAVSRMPGVEAASLGACEFVAVATAFAEAFHTFTLDSGASCCFFRDGTTVTPLTAPLLVALADPFGGLVIARASIVLPCPAVPFRSLPGLHLPLFSMNLVSIAVLQDELVTTTTPGGERVTICTCSRTGRHLVTFTQRPGSLSPLLRSLAPPCLPCVEGRQRAAPHSSSFPSTTAPLQTLHMDVWGPARIRGQDQEHYFLLVVDDYTRYTTVFPLRSKADVHDDLIPWITGVYHQLSARF